MESGGRRKPDATSAFKQQRLKAWQPLLTPSWVITSFAIIGIAFIPVGFILLHASNSVVEVSYRYDQDNPCKAALPLKSTCSFDVTIPDKMEGPIYFYYELSNFYQNHRRYVKSRSDTQLRNADDDVSNCSPLDTGNGTTYYPCGLIADSVFSDRISACLTVNGASVCNALSGDQWTKDGTCWDSDKKNKFKNRGLKAGEARPPHWPSHLSSVEDEEFIVWMRTAGLPTFRKLYRKINGLNLNKGDKLTITVENHFDTYAFDGHKSIVVSTTSWLGGKNPFLGYAYIVVGALCLVCAVVFAIKQFVSPRKLGDMTYFSWAEKGAAAK